MNFAFVRAINHQINPDINHHYTSLERDFIRYCKYGELEKIKQMLNYHEYLVHIFNDKPIRVAAKYGYLSVVKFLIANGANIYADNNYAFEYATRGGHLELIKYFVKEYGYDIDNEFYFNIAARRGHMNILKYLLSKGAEINDNVIKLLVEGNEWYRDEHSIYHYVMGLERITLRHKILLACLTKNIKLVRELTRDIDGSNACIDNSIVFTFVESYCCCIDKQFPIAIHLIKNCGANLSMLSKRNIKCKKLREYIQRRIKSRAIRMLYTNIRNKYSIPIDICKLIQSYV